MFRSYPTTVNVRGWLDIRVRFSEHELSIPTYTRIITDCWRYSDPSANPVEPCRSYPSTGWWSIILLTWLMIDDSGKLKPGWWWWWSSILYLPTLRLLIQSLLYRKRRSLDIGGIGYAWGSTIRVLTPASLSSITKLVIQVVPLGMVYGVWMCLLLGCEEADGWRNESFT